MDDEEVRINWKDDRFEIPDSHLQSPIRRDNRQLLALVRMHPADRIPNHILLMRKSCPLDLLTLELDSERMYGKILSSINTNDIPIDKWVNENLPLVYDTVIKFIQNHHPPGLETKTLVTSYHVSDRLKRSYSWKIHWESMRTMMQHLKNTRNTSWKMIAPVCDYIEKIYLSQTYMILLDTQGQRWLLDYDQVMMLSDTISSRVFSYWYMNLLDVLNPAKIDDKTLTDIYSIFDEVLELNGNDGYVQIKSWEPIIQGIILKYHDPLTYATNFYEKIKQELIDEDHHGCLDMIRCIESKNLSVYQLSELHGIYRHWGHPTVNESAGCAKVRNIAHTRPLPNYSEVQKMVALMNRQFCISFINMHGRWPRIDIKSKLSGTALCNVIKRGDTQVNFYSPRFPLDHWKLIKFNKEFELDYFLDFTEICDDKSISVYLQDLPSIYNAEVLGYKPAYPKSSRRVLLEVIGRKEIDIKSICLKIMKREVPESWKIILIHAKEREMKIEPRLFAMMVLEMRLYFCVTETNISKTIFNYFPQQTMTLSESELTKRLYSLSRQVEEDLYAPSFASIDFKSWNIHWQYLSTVHFFSTLDDLFGTPNLYTYTHVFFSESIVSLSSHTNPPETLKNNRPKKITNDLVCDTLWTDHKGGFEGLRQKGWTLITICLLLYVEFKTGIKSYIIGQGDNQICKMMIPKTDDTKSPMKFISMNQEYMSEQISLYMTTLRKHASDLGLVVKTEESWVSSQVINYGKEILVAGSYMSQGMKRISRVFPDVNEVYPTIMSKVSTIQTTGLAAAQKGYDIISPYIICQTETLLTIIREVNFSLIKGKTLGKEFKEWLTYKESLSYLLHGDTNLLSIPILGLNAYLYRGHPDPLSGYLSFIVHNAGHCKICKGIYNLVYLNQVPLGDGNPSLLVADPLSLNVERPPQISQMFKHYITTTLMEHTKNKHLRQIFHDGCIEEDNKTCEYLIKSTPLYPRVLHEIARLTPVGCRLSLAAKFSTTRTLQILAQRMKTKSFYGKIKDNETNNIDHWRKMYEKITYLQQFTMEAICPTLLTKKIRQFTWRKTIGDKDLEGVTIPFPGHQFVINYCSDLSHDGCKGYPEYLLFRPLTLDSVKLFSTRGELTPYLGSTTREKQTGKILQVPESSRPLSAAQRLVQLISWCVSPLSPFHEFMVELTHNRTDLPWEVLRLSSGDIPSGSMVHRLNDHITKRHTHHNFRPNIASHIYFSSDETGKYSRGSDNVNMHFQGAIHYTMAVMLLIAAKQQSLDFDMIHFHYNCIDCEEYLRDHKIVNHSALPPIKTLSGNPLVFATSGHIPNWVNPNVPFFQLTNKISTADSIAALILSRVIRSIGNSIWGVTERSTIFGSSVSIQDIIKAGIDSVLEKLAVLLYLYYYEVKDRIPSILSMFDNEIWKEFSSSCLLSEVLPELIMSSGGSVQPEIYVNHVGVVRILNRALSIKLYRLEKKIVTGSVTAPVFFLLPGCNSRRIFLMWSNLIYASTQGRTDLKEVCTNSNLEDRAGLNLPRVEGVFRIYEFIRQKGTETYITCLSKYPLKLSSLPPESVLGNRAILAPQKRDIKVNTSPVTLKPIRYDQKDMFRLIEFPENERDIHILSDKFLPSVGVQYKKNYKEHQYGLIGDLSCSFLKIMQILSTFQVQLNNPVVCLADGDGGITKYMTILSNYKVTYNSKVDTTKLIPQRATSFVPGEMAHDPSKVAGGDISALLGGDLTDSKYLNSLIKIVPGKASLVTMDAESDTPFTPKFVLDICKSTLKICVSCKSDWLIAKFYLDNPSSITKVIGVINTVYRKIYITVPVFSSNETTEIYIVATSYNPVVSLSQIGLYSTILETCSHSTVHKLKKERFLDDPFQKDNPVWRRLIVHGLKLGYQFNITHYCEKLVSYIAPFEGNLRLWFESIVQLCQITVQEELEGTGKIALGESLTVTERITVSGSRSMSSLVDKYSRILLYSTCVLTSLDLREKEVLNNIYSICEAGITHHINGVPVYVFRLDRVKIHNEIIKTIWKIWGYNKHSSYIVDMLKE